MQDCSRCKCRLSVDNFERDSNGDLSTRCNKCRVQDKEYRQRIYQRKPTIAETNPELLEEWDYEGNVGLRPDKLTPGSVKKVWWICKRDSHHRWETSLSNRTRKSACGCPICSNQLICPVDQCNSIGKVLGENGELKYANILEESDNKEDMYRYTPSSSKKIAWRCKTNTHHRWVGVINYRTRKIYHGCPICSNRIICPVDQCNSIGKVLNENGKLKYANLLEEFVDKEAIYKYTPSSNRRISWICKKNPHHKWETMINHRTGKERSGCPICTNHIICSIDQCNSVGKILDENGNLKYAYLLEEFANGEDAYIYTPSAHKKLSWICKKNPHHKWETNINHRTKKSANGCPICSNQVICPIDQCNSVGKVLDTNGNLKYANLLEEFDCKEDIYRYSPASNKKIPWKCKKDPHHKWIIGVCSRTGKDGSGCPICSNQLICPIDQCNSIGKVLDEHGRLKYTYLLEELIDAEDAYKYTPSSNKRVIWKCKNDFDHIWETAVCSRTGKNASGCPICRESKGEKTVSFVLHNNGIKFTPQKQKHMKVINYHKTYKLRFDFFGKINGIKFAIEYDGEQHFDSENYFSKKKNYNHSKIRDWLKTQWCAESGIKLLRIHYSDSGNIEKIVTKFVTDIECAEILTLSSNPNGDYDFMIGDSPP